MRSFFTILLLLLFVSCNQQRNDIKQDYFLKLDQIRNQKKEELVQYFSLIEKSLKQIETDGPLIHSFAELNKIHSSYKSDQKVEISVLKQHLSDENISQKFQEQKGHKEVLDYRGYRALSSFEVYPIFNLNWLLIAKMDIDEILSIVFWIMVLYYLRYTLLRMKMLNMLIFITTWI